MRHNQPGQHRAAPPRPSLADQLESLTPRFDVLTQRARWGGLTPRDIHELESDAQAIAADLVAAFRGKRTDLTHPPLYVSADGTKAGW